MTVVKAIKTSPDEWPTEVWVALDEEQESIPQFVELTSDCILLVDGQIYNKPFGWGDTPEEAEEDLKNALNVKRRN